MLKQGIIFVVKIMHSLQQTSSVFTDATGSHSKNLLIYRLLFQVYSVLNVKHIKRIQNITEMPSLIGSVWLIINRSYVC